MDYSYKNRIIATVLFILVIALICQGCSNSKLSQNNDIVSEGIVPDEAPVSNGNEQNSDDSQISSISDSSESSDEPDPMALTDSADEQEYSDIDADSSVTALLTPDIKVKGLYVTGPVAGSERMEEILSLVEATELNTLVIDIKNDEGNITYKMTLPEEYDHDACIRYVRDIPALLTTLHEKDIYVIGRIVCFKDPVLAQAKPELALKKPDGSSIVDANGLSFVNPCAPEVWDYLCTIAETATKDGFDEIQFDYVRFPIGRDAEEADYHVEKEANFRQDHLNLFFEYTSNRLHENNIIYGADLFGTVIGSDIDREQTGQNYADIAAVCDAICPMVYPSHYASGTFGLDVPDAKPYETIKNAMDLSNDQLTDVTDHGVIRPWLQCFNAIWVPGHITYDSAQITEQIQAVYDCGLDEWILWNASNHYEQVEEALSAFQ